MENYAERRQSPRTVNSRLEQLRENRPAWLYTREENDELNALVFDLSDTGCCFMLPKDYQLTSEVVTLKIEGDQQDSLEVTLPFRTIWIDEHFSHDEQKLGVEFVAISAEQKTSVEKCIACLDDDKAHSLRCLLKVKEELAFF